MASESQIGSGGLWVEEQLYPDWQQRFRIKRILVREKSSFQDILIFESFSHGRVLMLDGVVQVTETDEFVYQEMISHVPLVVHGEAKRVLIIGAGDGGVLRRVIQHDVVERVTMVEIDEAVVRLSREHMPAISGDAWSDPRSEVIIGDGIEYVANAPDNSFDVLIVDSTDPVGVGTVLFTDDFYRQAARILGSRGVIVNQCGVPAMQADELRVTSQRRLQHFNSVGAYLAAVPTYVGGFMTIGIASGDRSALTPSLEAATRYARNHLKGLTNYWTAEVHVASFALPPYIGRLLPR